jgi:hypothetical protein
MNVNLSLIRRRLCANWPLAMPPMQPGGGAGVCVRCNAQEHGARDVEGSIVICKQLLPVRPAGLVAVVWLCRCGHTKLPTSVSFAELFGPWCSAVHIYIFAQW